MTENSNGCLQQQLPSTASTPMRWIMLQFGTARSGTGSPKHPLRVTKEVIFCWKNYCVPILLYQFGAEGDRNSTDTPMSQIQQACLRVFKMLMVDSHDGECAARTRQARRNDFKTGLGERGWRVIFRRDESKHFEHRGHFSMAAGILPAASPKKDDYEYTKATESS